MRVSIWKNPRPWSWFRPGAIPSCTVRWRTYQIGPLFFIFDAKETKR